MNKKPKSFHVLSLHSLLSKKEIIISTFALVYVVFFAWHFLRAIFKSSLSNWVFTDWLINYSSGFVRRGLPGSILLFMAEHFNLNPYTSIAILVYLLYLVISIFYLYKVTKLHQFMSPGVFMVFLFLPSLLFFPLIDNIALGRKEILFLIPLILNIAFLSTEFKRLKIDELVESSLRNSKKLALSTKRYCQNILIVFNLLAIPITLSHESIIFLSLPVNLVITVSFLSLRYPGKRALLDSFVIYIPTFLFALPAFIWKGDATIALSICESWQNLDVIDCTNGPPAALGGIGWSLKQGVSLPWSVIKANHGLTFVQWLVIFGLNLVFLILSSSKLISNLLGKLDSDWYDKVPGIKPRKIYSSFSFKYAIIPLLFSIPLYVLGWDWGRWLFIIAISYSFCSLSSSLIYLEIIHQNRSREFNLLNLVFHRLCSVYSKFLANTFYVLKRYPWVYNISLIYMLLFIRLPHCCIDESSFYQGLIISFVDVLSAGLAFIFR